MEPGQQENQIKQPMSDEERLALAAKLDKELDEFIDGLEKRQYTEGWPEDRWEEEMDKHPFFMKKAPEPGDELHPLLEGIQQLKYDPAENTAEELATSYKEDGNFNFKHKKYRLAILSYTEGIKLKHDNAELKATLYNNRAASHYFLKNYRSCLRDCDQAIKYKTDYDKVLVRAANCCHELAQYERCIDLCDGLLQRQPTHPDMLTLRQRATNTQKTRERDARRRERAEVIRVQDERHLVEVIQARGIHLEKKEKTTTTSRGKENSDHRMTGIRLEYLEPHFPELASSRVHVVDDGRHLVWPVVILYPEYKTMDFIQQFHETVTIREQLGDILMEQSTWDTDGKYTHVDNVHVYYEHMNKTRVQRVNMDSSLAEVLVQPGYTVRAGTVSLIVLARDTPAEQHFLAQYKQHGEHK